MEYINTQASKGICGPETNDNYSCMLTFLIYFVDLNIILCFKYYELHSKHCFGHITDGSASGQCDGLGGGELDKSTDVCQQVQSGELQSSL